MGLVVLTVWILVPSVLQVVLPAIIGIADQLDDRRRRRRKLGQGAPTTAIVWLGRVICRALALTWCPAGVLRTTP